MSNEKDCAARMTAPMSRDASGWVSLHDKIMRAEPPKDLVQQYEEQSGHSAAVYYKLGHRDARLDAAELAYAQDALVAQLVEALELALDGRNVINMHVEPVLRSALAAAKEQQ